MAHIWKIGERAGGVQERLKYILADVLPSPLHADLLTPAEWTAATLPGLEDGPDLKVKVNISVTYAEVETWVIGKSHWVFPYNLGIVRIMLPQLRRLQKHTENI